MYNLLYTYESFTIEFSAIQEKCGFKLFLNDVAYYYFILFLPYDLWD